MVYRGWRRKASWRHYGMDTTKQMIDYTTVGLAGFGTHTHVDIVEGKWLAGRCASLELPSKGGVF